MENTALDVIEQRIDKLANILGAIPDDDGKSESLTDSLLSANTLISSAMSGRPNIMEAVTRMKELDDVLAPALEDGQSDLKTKEVYIKTIAPELASNFRALEEVKQLEKTLGAEYFRNIPDAGDNLRAMQNEAIDIKQKNEMFEESLTIGLQRYDRIQKEMNESLKKMSDRIDRIEERINQKLKKNLDQ